jgi:hypothetical protein
MATEKALEGSVGMRPSLTNFIWLHESGTYVKFTQAGANLFALWLL